MKNKFALLLTIFLSVISLAQVPGNPPPKAPIDQYDYTLIIAAVLILAITALYITTRKKLKKA